jgi:hypothetical protein
MEMVGARDDLKITSFTIAYLSTFRTNLSAISKVVVD